MKGGGEELSCSSPTIDRFFNSANSVVPASAGIRGTKDALNGTNATIVYSTLPIRAEQETVIVTCDARHLLRTSCSNKVVFEPSIC